MSVSMPRSGLARDEWSSLLACRMFQVHRRVEEMSLSRLKDSFAQTVDLSATLSNGGPTPTGGELKIETATTGERPLMPHPLFCCINHYVT